MVVEVRPSTTYFTIICGDKMRDGSTCGGFIARVDLDEWEATLEASKHVRQQCRKCRNWYSLYEHYGGR